MLATSSALSVCLRQSSAYSLRSNAEFEAVKGLIMEIKITHFFEIGEGAKAFIQELFGFRETNNVRKELRELREIIMANQAELVQEIAGIKEQMISVGQQIQAASAAQLAKISELEAQVAAGADLSAVASALAGLKESTQAIDDMVDDLPVEIPPVEA